MNQITKQIKENEENFGQKYPAVQCVTPGREFASDIASARQPQILDYLRSSQVSLLKTIKEALPETKFNDLGVIGSDVDKIYKAGQEVGFNDCLRRIKSFLDETIKESE